jgi:hypothetical protein
MTSSALDLLGIEIAPRAVTSNNVLFLGCSYTVGHGLLDTTKKYSSLFSSYYKKQEINLAESGRGNYRSFDLFGQLNIASGATVVLQLTELSRIRWYAECVKDVMLSREPNRELITVYNDRFLIYDLIRQLRIIVKFCQVNNIKLIVWSTARFGSDLDHVLETYLNKFTEYVFLDNRLGTDSSYRIDNAADGTDELGTGHPGPKSNQLIAEKLINHFNKLYS